LTTSTPRFCQDRVKRRRELAGPITDEEPEPAYVFAEVHDEVAGLLGVGCQKSGLGC
jgi:hypothetical protein